MNKSLFQITFFAMALATPPLLLGDGSLPPRYGLEVKAFPTKNYETLIGMAGFSEGALKNHFQLYEGYVKNTNELLTRLQKLSSEENFNAIEFSELKRRFGWEFAGMRLHELYFENLGGIRPISKRTPLFKAIEAQFGSFEAWKKDFIQTGLMRGIGWAILYQDTRTGRLLNTWINEHDLGHLAGGNPILVMDVFEHAYLFDYQLDRKSYIEAFFKNIQWEVSEKRFENRMAI